MKKKVFAIFIFLLVFSIFFVSAELNQTAEEKAYSCISEKVDNKCSTLSTEEKLFSLLTLGKCKTELLSDALNNQCWPKTGCRIKTTAQSILALSKTGSDISKAESWLSNKNMTSSDLDWFLQVESNNATSCKATYSGTSYSFSVDEDKTLSGNAGSCLSIYQGYWLKISSSCLNKNFDISCSNSFLTSLLYKKKTSSTIYISDKTDSASGEGKTSAKINSFCLSTGTSCDYEGTLWATYVLKSRGKDISPFIPYLIAMADENAKYIPESFLYSLTGNFRTDLLAKQKESKWWLESGDKFYDTAVGLLPFQNEDSLMEKTNSVGWLSEVQDKDGCWQGNLRNTAFLLYSLWPKTIAEPSTTPSCENSNHFCMSSASCSQISGNVLGNYSGCFGANICCDKALPLESCSEQSGELCSSTEDCIGGSFVSSSDSTSSKSCCVYGTCGVKVTSECEENNGICKSSCLSSEQLGSYSCPISGICCVEKKTPAISIFTIILLVVLIVLVVLGIIFRKKLQEFYFKLKSGGKGKPTSTTSPRFPPTSSARVYPGAVPRRIIPNQQTRTQARPPMKNKSEFDDVLKKLKEIGK